MPVLSDRWIREQAQQHAMIEPFVEAQRREGCISYGLSSYGYDARVADEFKIFTNVNSATVDPKDFAANSFVDRKTDVCIIPPNSFALARTVEYFRVPRDVLVICLGKSTYARCGIIVNVTPLEPGWEGHVTLEFSNTTPLPAKVYANEGACQFLFLQGNEPCEVSYADRAGKYMRQQGVTLPQVVTRDEAAKLDAADPLAFARERFRLPDGLIYLDGNSLGALPVLAAPALAKTAEAQWGQDLISSWTKHEWIDWPTRVAAKLAPLVGARPSELLIADSTSVCLFKLLGAAVRARPGRRTVLTRSANFPTDLYVAQGLCEMLGLTLKAMPADEVVATIDEDTAVVTLTHVDYRSGALFDMAAVNAAAHRAGALTVWDMSHSAGAFELDLNGTNCDLAVGCGYKYLNGGPGAPAFVYVAEHLQDGLQPPLQGWMGHAEPFAFDDDYRPAPGITRFLTGTPSVLAMAALDAGLSTFDGIAMGDIAIKSRALSQLFIAEVETRCGPAVRLASPRDANKRGSHVVFAHPEAYAVMQALIARGVVGDFRAPDLMRFGFAPLYNRYADVARAGEILGEIIASGEWDQPRFRQRGKVT